MITPFIDQTSIQALAWALVHFLWQGAVLGLMAFGTWFSRRVKTEKDYFLAGRSLPFWAIGMSIVATDIGAVDFVALGGLAYRHGVVAANFDWIGTMPAIIIAAFIYFVLAYALSKLVVLVERRLRKKTAAPAESVQQIEQAAVMAE